MRNDAGFSLLEMLIAMGIMMAITGGIFTIMNPSQGTFAAQPEAADMQQRLRVASDSLYKDLVMAGGGAYQGAMSGSLVYMFATVMPFRQGSTNDDPPGTFRTDLITLMYVAPTLAQTTLATKGPSLNSSEIGVNPDPGCPTGDALCGFKEGMTVLIYDASGAYDTFTITNVQTNALHLQHNNDKLTYTDYQPNTTKIVQMTNAVYYLNKPTNQLMYYDGSTGPDVPVVDHVVGLTFDYYGDPQPPQLTGKPLSDPVGPWTTYGPTPPSLAAQIPTKGYPTGENCMFIVSSGSQVPRLPVLGAGGTTQTLVKLTSTELTDGPWCPDPTNVNRWDADLMRIRKIGVTIRVESANAAMRGPAGVLFTNGGTSRGAERWLPDFVTTLQVTPRNLNLGR